jgi:predicted nucleic acid-binding protein
VYLVDTSVWIDSLRQRDNPPVRFFRRLLDQNVPYGITGVIYQEVLQGARSPKDFETLQDYLGSQRFYHPLDLVASHAEAARIFRKCRSEGITIRSTIDCLIAQIAIEHDLMLLHNDRDFTCIAQVAPTLHLVGE